ncbi:lipase [Rhizoctonia solani 123E]|uniref:Lipase n=1 Tax=Rhizoctonia solani 123E TaxID=1423351 RepID=A0A074RZ73_9AGAM|nr:lipase [Rhizoctonia solani 123E]
MLLHFSILATVFPLGVFATLPDVTSITGSVFEDANLIKVGHATPLGASEIDSYIPYGHFSTIAYCPPETRNNWRCKSCQTDLIRDFQLYKSGGDGDKFQYWYVGWWPSQNTVVVGRQGTDFSKLYASIFFMINCFTPLTAFPPSSWPVVTDVTLVQLPTNRFPSCPATTKVHLGFLESHKRSIDPIFEAVRTVLAEKEATRILTVSHSLGAALAMLDGLYMREHLASSIDIRVRTLGGPRVGNKDFANCFDTKIPDMVRITNKRDPIPILPPVVSGYMHTLGEKHINLKGMWHNCAGQENLNNNCSVGEAWINVPTWPEHDGPYAGGIVTRQSSSC